MYGLHLVLKIDFFAFSTYTRAQTIVEQKSSIFRVRYKAIYAGLLIYSTLPGTCSGGINNDNQATTTNMEDGI